MSSEGSGETAQFSFSFIFTYAIIPYPSYNMRAQVSFGIGFNGLVSSQSLQFI